MLEGSSDTIDATDKLVLPGGIEAHCHIAQESANGIMTADGYATGSVSAAFGGNSCFIPFAAQMRGMSIAETLDLYDSRSAGQSVIDYSWHLIVSDPTPDVLAELPLAFERGVTSFKVFMTYPLLKLDDEQFLDILALAKQHGALTMVHAENNAMIDWMSKRLLERGLTTPRYHALSHPELAEEEAIHRAICLAKLVDTALLIVHVSTRAGASLVEAANRMGAQIYGETCPQYLFLTRDDLDRDGFEGAKFMCSPPVRDVETQDVLWDHIRRGTFAVVSSDHAPYRYDESGKLSGGSDATFKQIANGMPGIALRLPMLFSEGVVRGRLTLNDFVALSSTNAAKLYGLHPKKGTIAVGADCDIAQFGSNCHSLKITVADDYTPYEGMEVTGWPIAVMTRGKMVMQNGEMLGSHDHGQFQHRKRFDRSIAPGYCAPEMDHSKNFGTDLMP
ncbi:UNVERIFIED_CONTAM: hypothetical protein GTU68_011694 [Idotea baltica]|nr:hypothetical protein [Idotea baltica]